MSQWKAKTRLLCISVCSHSCNMLSGEHSGLRHRYLKRNQSLSAATVLLFTYSLGSSLHMFRTVYAELHAKWTSDQWWWGQCTDMQFYEKVQAGSDFDTVAWRPWMHEYIAFSHRSDGVLGTNASLVVDALRELGHYSETLNPAFTFPRRYAVQDITVKGIWFTRDVTTDVRVLARLLQTTVRSVPHAFSAAMQVQQLAQVDVAAVHRVALPFSNQTAVEVRMQRGAVATLEIMCLAGLVMAAAFRRCRAGVSGL